MQNLSELAAKVDKLAEAIEHQATAISNLVATAAELMDTLHDEQEDATEYLDGSSCL